LYNLLAFVAGSKTGVRLPLLHRGWPGATASWFCLSDAQGHVDNVSFTGKDGD
jgi:hypothetical protein